MAKKDNKEEEILRAAEKLFAEKGFKGATTTLIAAEAGVTHAMLHYYFRTKDQIFLKVFDSYMEEVRQDLKAIMVPEIYDTDLITKVTEICFDFFNSHSGEMNLFLEVAKERPDLLGEYVSEFGRYIGTAMSAHKERTERAVSEGVISDISFTDLLTNIVSVCAAPFFFEPVISNVIGMDKERKAAFLEARKREAVKLIVNRIAK
jgi:AcrR family transcriptional regulator